LPPKHSTYSLAPGDRQLRGQRLSQRGDDAQQAGRLGIGPYLHLSEQGEGQRGQGEGGLGVHRDLSQRLTMQWLLVWSDAEGRPARGVIAGQHQAVAHAGRRGGHAQYGWVSFCVGSGGAQWAGRLGRQDLQQRYGGLEAGISRQPVERDAQDMVTGIAVGERRKRLDEPGHARFRGAGSVLLT
jgi:hypothetical protein